MSPNRKWRHQFQLWREEKGSEETVIRLLRRHQKIGIDINIIQQSLSEIHQSLDSELLDPRLLPTSLLLYPSTWRPTEIQTTNWLVCIIISIWSRLMSSSVAGSSTRFCEVNGPCMAIYHRFRFEPTERLETIAT